ncbi:putative glutamate receptor [Caerostris extrusa]|uniref:Glutamate receptor n=1 Tax=Caerostris extrusa TaxID=172846 RepID=A0AAV4XCG0_CAEEX|nr:putative glutamate receptor [Caerostris extrusa]
MIASTQARREVVDFSFPYSIDGTTFSSPRPYIIIERTGIFLSIRYHFVDKYNDFNAYSTIAFKYILRDSYPLTKKLFFDVFGSFTGLPLNSKIKGFGPRIACLSWLFYVKIIALCYCTFCFLFLTIPLKSAAIRDVYQLTNIVKDGQYKCHIFRGTSDQETFYNAYSGPLKIIADYVKKKK